MRNRKQNFLKFSEIEFHFALSTRLGPVNSKSFVGKDLLRIKWKFELQHETIVKSFDL